MDKYMGVSTNDPDIVNAIHNIKKRGGTKEQALKIVGMPFEVIDRHWQNAERGEQTVPVGEPPVTTAAEISSKPQRSEAEIQTAKDRMAKARAARKPKK